MAPDTNQVTYKAAAGADLSAYYARPEGSGPFPAVVVIHEAFGLNANIRSIAERFAVEGYAALAVDLFAGRNRAVCMAQLMGGAFLNSFDHSGIKNLKVSLDYLIEQPEIDKARIGAVGYCMGGGLAIAWATTDQRLKVIAPYYGINPRPLEAVARSCPVVGSYPQNDFTKGQGERLEMELDKHNIPHDIKIYAGARHSFFNDRGANYDPAASADSWQRVLAFFKQHLG